MFSIELKYCIALGQLAKESNLAVQSHISENKTEVELISKLQPYSSYKHYCDVYEDCGLLGPRCLYAHRLWLEKYTKKLSISSYNRVKGMATATPELINLSFLEL